MWCHGVLCPICMKTQTTSFLISFTFTRRERVFFKDQSSGETHVCVQQQAFQRRSGRRWWRVCKWKNTPKSEEEWYLHSDDNTIFAGWRDESRLQPTAAQAKAKRIDSEDDGVPAPVRASCLPWLGSDSEEICSGIMSTNCSLIKLLQSPEETFFIWKVLNPPTFSNCCCLPVGSKP